MANHIPKTKYQVESNIPHITYDQIVLYHSGQEVKNFKKFMYGQTMMIRKDGVPGIYVCDYERWLQGGMDAKQGLGWD